MKRIIVAVVLGVSFLFSSCEGEGNPSKNTDSNEFVGGWSMVEEWRENEEWSITNGDFVVIDDKTISFYYNSGYVVIEDKLKLRFEYENPNIFIAGVNAYDVISVSHNRMVWKDMYGSRYVLTRFKECGIDLVGKWKFTESYIDDFTGNLVSKSFEANISIKGNDVECVDEYGWNWGGLFANPYFINSYWFKEEGYNQNVTAIKQVVKTGANKMEWREIYYRRYYKELDKAYYSNHQTDYKLVFERIK